MSLEAAYIVPHPPLAVAEVGRGTEAAIDDTLNALNEVGRRIAALKPETIIFVSPHSAYYSDWIYVASGEETCGDLGQFGAPQVSFNLRYDAEFRNELIEDARKNEIPAGIVSNKVKELDHGLMVPLYFIEKKLDPASFKAVSLGGSGLPDETLIRFGRCIARVAIKEEKPCILVVSGDLSHKLKRDGPYGFDPAGPLFDEFFGDIIRKGKLLEFSQINHQLRKDAAECGLSGFLMLAGVLEEVVDSGEPPLNSKLLSLEGPFGVGYGVASFEKVTE